MLGGLPGLLVYKIVNTADSMIGYRTPRYADFGWAAARMDDLLNLAPARLTALLIALPGGVLHHWRDIKSDAALHRSPNAGWPEAMVARLLGVQLGGTNFYQGVASHRATLGEPLEILGVAHINATIRLMHGAWMLFMLLSVGVIAGLLFII